MNPNIILRNLVPDDLLEVARVHINSFPDSALTKLGSPIIQRYYLWQLTGPHKKVRAVGAFIGGECVGFSFSGIFHDSTSGFIHLNKLTLIRKSLMRPWLLFNPLFLKRIREGVKLLRRFTRKKAASKRSIEQSQSKSYGILSIAVSQNHQKLGIGQLLIQDAENEALRDGYDQICLTVHPDNQKAVRFYEKQNWQKFLQSDLWDGAMIKPLK